MSYQSIQFEQQQDFFGEVTTLMIEAAGLKTGDHVLDIAAGMGGQSLVAAQKIGATGTVLATDISAEMLMEAKNLAEQEGYHNITTEVMNAEHLTLPDQRFDAVISRLGLMLINDQPQALGEIIRVLKPDHTLAALVWSAPERNPFLSLLPTTVAKYTSTMPLSAPFFSLAGPGTYEQTLQKAGFRQVRIQALAGFPLPFRCTVEEFFEAPNNGLALAALQELDSTTQERVREEVKQALRPFEQPESLVFPAEMLLGVGVR